MTQPLALALACFGCGSSQDSGPSEDAGLSADGAHEEAEAHVPSDARTDGENAPAEAGTGTDASEIDAMAHTDAPSSHTFDGIWRKVGFGGDFIVENDCGAFYLLDFDYEYNRFERNDDTLTISYCEDVSCAVVDPVVETLEIDGNVAAGSDPSTMDLPGCTIDVASETELVLESDTAGRFRWVRGLTYTGSQCEAYKDAAMTGDTCTAVAEVDIVRVSSND